MRILQVHNRYRRAQGGEEAVLDLERELLQERGHSVGRFEVSNKSVKQYTLRAGVETIWSPRSYREMREVLRRECPDVVHFHNTFVRLSPSVYWAAVAEGIPVVQTLHNYRLTCANGLLMHDLRPCEECVGRFPWPALIHRTYRDSLGATAVVVGMQQFNRLLGTYRNKVDAYITPTDFARDIMVRSGLPQDKIHIKPHFAPDPLNGGKPIEERAEQVVYVGRLFYEKGVDLLLEAWRQLAPAGTRLVIIGDGPERARLTHNFGKLPGIEWRGWLKRSELLREVAYSKYLVMPSRGYETFGLVMPEALSLGTPVIAPDHGAFPDMISPGDNGFLFAPNDENALAKTLERALQLDRSLWQQWSKNARTSYLNRFTPEANYHILIGIYEKAMLQSGGG